jgi:RNA recognition motif-containing protein
MNLFVANISRAANEEALRSLFTTFGEVISVKIINDRDTGQSKGFGFVEMLNSNEAQIALEKLTNAEFWGRNLVVSKAHAKVPAIR